MELFQMDVLVTFDAELFVLRIPSEDLLFVFHMTLGAALLGVLAGQWEARFVVVKVFAGFHDKPTIRHVTLSAALRQKFFGKFSNMDIRVTVFASCSRQLRPVIDPW